MANMDGMDLPAAADLFIPTGLLDADTVSFLTALHARVRTPSVIFLFGRVQIYDVAIIPTVFLGGKGSKIGVDVVFFAFGEVMLYKSIQYSVMALGGLCGHLTDWLIKSFFCGSLSKRCHPFGRRKTTVVPESGWMQDASSPAIVWDKNHQVVVRGFLKHWTSIFDGLGIDLDSLSHVDYVGHM